MYKSLISILMLGAAVPCLAKDGSSPTAPASWPFTNSLIVSATVGAISGLGAEAKASILPQLNARLGFSIISANYVKNNYTMDDIETSINARAALNKIHLLAEYRPLTHSAFRIVGGFGYFFNSKATIHLAPVSNYTVRKLEIAKEELGEVNGTVDWSGISPYLGIGMGNSVPKKRFNITVDAGVYYLSRPKVTIDATKLLEPNKANEEQLSQNLKGYRWVPQLQFNFNYKLFSKTIIKP